MLNGKITRRVLRTKYYDYLIDEKLLYIKEKPLIIARNSNDTKTLQSVARHLEVIAESLYQSKCKSYRSQFIALHAASVLQEWVSSNYTNHLTNWVNIDLIMGRELPFYDQWLEDNGEPHWNELGLYYE